MFSVVVVVVWLFVFFFFFFFFFWRGGGGSFSLFRLFKLFWGVGGGGGRGGYIHMNLLHSLLYFFVRYWCCASHADILTDGFISRLLLVKKITGPRITSCITTQADEKVSPAGGSGTQADKGGQLATRSKSPHHVTFHQAGQHAPSRGLWLWLWGVHGSNPLMGRLIHWGHCLRREMPGAGIGWKRRCSGTMWIWMGSVYL